MMNPVVRVFVQRAGSRRHSLLELARVIADEYLERVAPGDDWSARGHLAHSLAIDGPMAELFRTVASGADSSELSVAMTGLADQRMQILEARQQLPVEKLVETSHEERHRLVESASYLLPIHLEVVLPIPGARNAWGDPLGITVFQYLEQWANHDSVHEESIRLAIATKPDLSTVALTRRLR